MAISKELGNWLLERQTAGDPLVRPADAAETRCPKCGQPGQRVTKALGRLPERRLTTEVGEVALEREQWRCATCRVAFFPLDQKLNLGTEGYSPQVLQKAVRQAAKVSFQEASDDLHELASIAVSAMHLQFFTLLQMFNYRNRNHVQYIEKNEILW